MRDTKARPGRRQRLASSLRVVKIAAGILTVMLFALSVLYVMALSKFDSALKGAVESQIGVIAYDVRDTIEAGLALGANLQTLQNTQDVIKRATARDSKIKAIYVFGREGETLYSAPATAHAMAVLEANLLRKASDKRTLKSLRAGDALDAVTEIQNSFGLAVGSLVIKYDATALDTRAAALRKVMLTQVLYFLLGGVLVATIIISVLLKKFDRADELLACSLDAYAESTPPELVLFKLQELEAHRVLDRAEHALEAA